MTAPAGVLVASAPVSFGVQRLTPEDAWIPDPIEVLDAVAALGYDGIQLGPPGFLGNADELRSRLQERGLRLADAFVPMHFSRSERFEEDRTRLHTTLSLLADASDSASRPVVLLAEGFGEPPRMKYSGRIEAHPEVWLPPERFPTLIDNLHRAAEECRSAGFEVVLHHHAGTYIETPSEIKRVLDVMDPTLVGLCLDTGHAFFGGADPAAIADDYHELVRHVHLKDVSRTTITRGFEEGLDFVGLTAAGAFCPLGEGDARIAAIISVLLGHGYGGWFVVETDRFLFKGDRFEDAIEAQRKNRQFLRALDV